MIETLKAYLFRKKITSIKKYKIADTQNDLELNNYNYEFKKTIEKSKFFKIN